MSEKSIKVIGARQNNLKNVNCEIPRNKFTVLTGVSGSGKSSLAYDVIYAEAQRRFFDIMSPYERGRVKYIKKPNVDIVSGLSPAVALEQCRHISNRHSTVGTITDIYDFCRLLFATAGYARCPICGKKINQLRITQIIDRLSSLSPETNVELRMPVNKLYGESYEYTLNLIRKKGFKNIYIDGVHHLLSEKLELDKKADYFLEVVVDRFSLSNNSYKYIEKKLKGISEVLESLLLRVEIIGKKTDLKREFYRNIACEEHHYFLPELNSFRFSFNYPSTSHCYTCNGVGMSFHANEKTMLSKPNKSINDGAFRQSVYNPDSTDISSKQIMYSLSIRYGFSLDEPYISLPDRVKHILLYGNEGEEIDILQDPRVGYSQIVGQKLAFQGLICRIESEYRKSIRGAESGETTIMEFLESMLYRDLCPECKGDRLKSQFLDILIGERNIAQISRLQLADIKKFMQELEFEEIEKTAALSVVEEIQKRVQQLLDIGLYYLDLFRGSDTLSGGEMQRIQMATHLSNDMQGMIYIIDEPTSGLHERDTHLVVDILKRLRDEGNTVIVVEHDLNLIKNADYVIEMGPGPGEDGGEIVFSGSVKQLINSKDSITGYYLRNNQLSLNRARSEITSNCLTIKGAKANNLKEIEVSIPLNVLVCITGVSGSGKSTLIHDTLFKQICFYKGKYKVLPGENSGIDGHEQIDSIYNINQLGVGRSSISCPATYLNVFGIIRKLYASLPKAKESGFTVTDFTFTNSQGLRCDCCEGRGVTKTKFYIMADIENVCPVCEGSRYTDEALDIRYRGKNIAEILQMSMIDALEFFHDIPSINRKLSKIVELGLGYITLGQRTTTLSGGELQRLGLAKELAKLKRGKHNLYILDEPTTGLHSNDIEKLLICMDQHVQEGHTVILIEHHLGVINCADYIIDLGPEGGQNGGYVIAQGTVEDIINSKKSLTGKFLKNYSSS